MTNKINLTEPVSYEIKNTKGYVRYAYLFIKGLTKVGWSDLKNICCAIVGKDKDDKELLFPDKENIKNKMISCMLNMRSGIKGHKGYFKILEWEDFK